jgi:hypothetical protein
MGHADRPRGIDLENRVSRGSQDVLLEEVGMALFAVATEFVFAW